MHVGGEGIRPNYPVGGNAVGRGVEPREGDVKMLVDTITHCQGTQRFIKLVLLVLTRSVRLGWGRRSKSFLP